MTQAERTELQAFSKRMHGYWQNGPDLFRRVRCHTLFQNARHILDGDESPELRRAIKKNADDLVRYDAGAYDHLKP